MDQHAAAERIRYEKYIVELTNPSKISQELLIPSIIELTKTEKIFIDSHIDDFSNLGITIEDASDSSIYLRSVPVWILGDPVTSTEEMIKYAQNMEFEKAAKIRDKIKELTK